MFQGKKLFSGGGLDFFQISGGLTIKWGINQHSFLVG